MVFSGEKGFGMRTKSIIISILAVILIFGTMIAGCKRDNRTAMNSSRQAPSKQQRRGRESVRPAEVLSASTARTPRMDGTAYLIQDSSTPVMVAQSAYVLPPPTVGPVYTDYSSSANPAAVVSAPYSTYYPEYAGYTGYVHSQPQVINTPELAMAKASLPPQPVVYQTPTATQPRALPPIPELEPVRYRAPAARTSNRPVAEIMMSANGDRHDVQRALAPIGPADPAQGWVSSPTTAMRF